MELSWAQAMCIGPVSLVMMHLAPSRRANGPPSESWPAKLRTRPLPPFTWFATCITYGRSAGALDQDDGQVVLREQPVDQLRESLCRPPPFDHEVRRVRIDREITAGSGTEDGQFSGNLVAVLVLDPDPAQAVGHDRPAPHELSLLQVDVTDWNPYVEVHQMRVIAPLVLRRLPEEPDPIPREAEQSDDARIGRIDFQVEVEANPRPQKGPDRTERRSHDPEQSPVVHDDDPVDVLEPLDHAASRRSARPRETRADRADQRRRLDDAAHPHVFRDHDRPDGLGIDAVVAPQQLAQDPCHAIQKPCDREPDQAIDLYLRPSLHLEIVSSAYGSDVLAIRSHIVQRASVRPAPIVGDYFRIKPTSSRSSDVRTDPQG